MTASPTSTRSRTRRRPRVGGPGHLPAAAHVGPRTRSELAEALAQARRPARGGGGRARPLHRRGPDRRRRVRRRCGSSPGTRARARPRALATSCAPRGSTTRLVAEALEAVDADDERASAEALVARKLAWHPGPGARRPGAPARRACWPARATPPDWPSPSSARRWPPRATTSTTCPSATTSPSDRATGRPPPRRRRPTPAPTAPAGGRTSPCTPPPAPRSSCKRRVGREQRLGQPRLRVRAHGREVDGRVAGRRVVPVEHPHDRPGDRVDVDVLAAQVAVGQPPVAAVAAAASAAAIWRTARAGTGLVVDQRHHLTAQPVAEDRPALGPGERVAGPAGRPRVPQALASSATRSSTSRSPSRTRRGRRSRRGDSPTPPTSDEHDVRRPERPADHLEHLGRRQPCAARAAATRAADRSRSAHAAAVRG